MKLGQIQKLKVISKKDHGIYLGDENERVLLPAKQVPEGTKIGDELSVFCYRDSDDRLICTTKLPLITVGEVARLKVLQKTKIGTFLDMGLERDLFLPYKEHTTVLKEGQEVVVAMYVDKSDRLAATMKIYPYLNTDSFYKKDDEVKGYVYEKIDSFGCYVAVDDSYSAMIPRQDCKGIEVGQDITARVVEVREDGKLTLNPRKKAYLQMEDDMVTVLKVLEEYSGILPYNDKASAAVIENDFHMSKNAFKRAVGHLYKNGKIEITDQNIKIL